MQEGRTKKAVVVTARVHPGETNGSWMMEGFLDFLLSDSEDAQLLRDTFVFKVRDPKLTVSHCHCHDFYKVLYLKSLFRNLLSSE